MHRTRARGSFRGARDRARHASQESAAQLHFVTRRLTGLAACDPVALSSLVSGTRCRVCCAVSSSAVSTIRELLAGRAGVRGRPKVSVQLLTFNHAEFVAQALESVLDQTASFEWEIVVGDDGSTDGTAEILKSYARKHPGRIRLLLHPQGLGPHELNLQGNNNLLATYRACRGEYVALLDGDDYWTDDKKLEKQARFLDTHGSCSLCCHAVAVEYSGERSRHWDRVIGLSRKEFCSIEDFSTSRQSPSCR